MLTNDKYMGVDFEGQHCSKETSVSIIKVAMQTLDFKHKFKAWKGLNPFIKSNVLLIYGGFFLIAIFIFLRWSSV